MISYMPTFVPNKVLIIGGGGTGGRLVPLIAQFLKVCAWVQNPEITIIDDDVVEEKNLQRQNFIMPDVGKPKAQVLAQRYSRAFNIQITPVVARVTPFIVEYMAQNDKRYQANADMQTIFNKYANNAIIVMCVDSPEARRHILGRIMVAKMNNPHGNILLLDSGNENDFGQVSVSTGVLPNTRGMHTYLRSWGRTVPGDLVLPCIPLNTKYFTEMTVEKGKEALSCADLDQTMAINTLMANTMFGIIQNLLYSKPITFHRINVTLKDGSTPEYMNPEFLLQHGTEGQHKYMDASLLQGLSNGMGYAYPQLDVSQVISDFHLQTFTPYKKAMDKMKLDEATAKAKAEQKLKDDAVKAAMKMHGWKIPGQEEEAAKPTPKPAPSEKEVLAGLMTKQFAELLEADTKPAVKRVARKVAVRTWDDITDGLLNA